MARWMLLLFATSVLFVYVTDIANAQTKDTVLDGAFSVIKEDLTTNKDKKAWVNRISDASTTQKDQREDVLRYLASGQAYWGSYHTQTLTNAWAVLALMLVFAAFIYNVIKEVSGIQLFHRLVVSLSVILVSIGMNTYAVEQFKLHQRGAYLVSAYIYLQASITANPEWRPEPKDWEPERLNGPTLSDYFTPKAVENIVPVLKKVSNPSLSKFEIIVRSCIWIVCVILVISSWKGYQWRQHLLHPQPDNNSITREQWISDRAYSIWQDSGCPDGKNIEHWEIAEYEWEKLKIGKVKR